MKIINRFRFRYSGINAQDYFNEKNDWLDALMLSQIRSILNLNVCDTWIGGIGQT